MSREKNLATLAASLLFSLILSSGHASAQTSFGGEAQTLASETKLQNLVIVSPKFGGQILGYAIDPSGSEGVLSEFVTQSDGKVLAATETFSQSTGKILQVIAKTDTQDDFVAEGVFGSTALILYQHDGKNAYPIMKPLEQNKFNGIWKPPIMPNYDFWTLAGTGLSSNVAAYQTSFVTGKTFVFSSNINTNTFGPQISLAPIQDGGEFFQPQIALGSDTNQAVLADSLGCDEPGCVMSIALVNLSTGEMSKFTQDLGLGTVNGLAVDPRTHIACTTTSADGGVEFYNLATQTGFEVLIPNFDGTPLDSGLSVAFDPLHSLFFVSQWSSNGGNTDNPQPRIYVYDEQGNVQGTIVIVRIPISPVPMVLHPSNRTGFIMSIGQNAVNQVQSFAY